MHELAQPTGAYNTSESDAPFTRGGWTAVCKDSLVHFRPITIEKGHLAADREMSIPSIVRLNNFVFFPRFPSWIRQEIPLLV